MITRAIIELIERGWFPDSWTRFGIRRLCQQRLQALRAEFGSDPGARTRAFVEQTYSRPIAPVPEKANEQHYEVPAEFFQRVLGDHLKYSCCYFGDDIDHESATGLRQAEEQALRITSEHAGLEDGMRILELGCGWGSLTLWMANHFPQSQIVAVSNSHSQREFIMAQAAAQGIADRVTVVTCDMNDFEPEQSGLTRGFDRVISVEMFEHMRNYRELLQRIDHWLSPRGKLLVHIFCHRQFTYEFQADGASNWMGRYFFSGGIMPGADLFSHFDEHLQVEQSWRWSGVHYQKTCEAWNHWMHVRRREVMPILARTYGNRHAVRWFNRWKMFFLAGAELFGFDDGREWQVAHYLFTPKNSLTKDREFSNAAESNHGTAAKPVI